MTATLDRIDRRNPAVNAIVALRERADLLAEAAAADRAGSRGRLHGLPMAVKDLEAVRGIRSTSGSPILADWAPDADSPMVARLRAAGAIFIGKTNVPEFGLGSHTYNPVYGPTRNPYDLSRTPGGSSGGAAVALSLRMLALADGSDFGGSLRNPAGWNNVFGFRPSIGRVPSSDRDAWLPAMGVLGPMARNVADIGLLLSVQAGFDPRAPLSLPDDPAVFAGPLDRDLSGLRVAWCGDWGGAIPFEPGVLDLCRAALATFTDLGCTVEEAVPDFEFERLWQSFVTLRWWQTGTGLRVHAADPAARALLKPEALYEIEHGSALSAFALSDAAAVRTAWTYAVAAFFERFDALVMPTAQLFPFPVEQNWPHEIAGRAMRTYHEWMQIVVPATMAGAPVVAVPAGFDPRGLPMGLQIMGRAQADLAVLQLGHAYDRATGWPARRPPVLAV